MPELKPLEYVESIFETPSPPEEEDPDPRGLRLILKDDGEETGSCLTPGAPRPKKHIVMMVKEDEVGVGKTVMPPTPLSSKAEKAEADKAAQEIKDTVKGLIEQVEEGAKAAIAAEVAASAAPASVDSPGAATATASPDAPSADPPAPVDDDAGKCTIQTPNIEDFDIDDKDKVIDYILKIIENKGENKGENTLNFNNIFSACYKYIKEKVKTQDRTSKKKKRKQNIDTLRNNITNGSAPIMVNLQKLTNNQYYFELFAYILKYILTLFDYSKDHKYEGNFDPSSQGDRINNFKIFLKMERLKDKTSQCIYSEKQSLKNLM